MRGTVSLSLLASALVVNAFGADDVIGMFNEGKVSGQFREFSISREVDDTRPAANNDYTRKANTIGGYLKYETGAWNGLSLGAAVYGTIGVHLGNRSNVNDVDPTLLSKDNQNDFYLGEAYLQYKNGNTTFKAGRQKLDTPMVGSDDARMLPNLFEAYVLTNTDVKDTTLVAAHVTKFAQGTFGRAYTSGILSATSGYSLVDARGQTGDFTNMGEYAIGEKTDGVSVAAAIYSGIPGLKLQLWDYYAHDILNAVYAEANYGFSMGNGVAPYVAAQWINERDVGSNNVAALNKVESDFVAGKIGVKVANFDVYAAVSHNSKDSASDNGTHGGTISPWGGMPAYTQGMVTRHQFMAGTDAWKAAASYDWKNFGVKLNTSVYYAEFDMDKLNGYAANHAWTAKEKGFDVIFNPETIKNLQLRLRANYTDDFYDVTTGSVSWDEYRFILNYNF
ncbi:outer membrane porin [Sulfuricurvum kujiense DSM 16994]|uniref:Outer membrane porin n=1 Tax=Sulfuricurvum kujiense (strain ATCC BAA-921 / DSM 16994 / JCM 11577 / YK-1) TaxID=709032 RepID=E4U1F7_SULKY|nr:OprD family outer membrane porin [Sulfuricurvum kujiense]ADR34494.1 outer membrane porin [Sulfuricurvum kujiense DSM 16994]